MTPEENFRSLAPKYMKLFMSDFHCSLDDAAAAFGNFGHESLGFTVLQEQKPVIEGSAGGYGWPQWTGPRRRNYLSYCERNKKDPAADASNYAYIFVELNGRYSYAIERLKRAKTLSAKVKAFELAYEGAGVKHYESRNRWAEIARDAYLETEKVA